MDNLKNGLHEETFSHKPLYIIEESKKKVNALLSNSKYVQAIKKTAELERKNTGLALEICEYKKSDEIKHLVVSGIKHDINNIQSQILMVVTYLKSDFQVLSIEEVRGLLDIVESGSLKICKIEDNYFDKISKVFSGKYIHEPSMFSLVSTLSDVEKIFEILKRNKDIEFEYEINGKYGKIGDFEDDVMYIGDIDLFHCHIYTNLYKNALEAAPEGSKVIVRYRNSGLYSTFSIENEPEISGDILSRLFSEQVSTKDESRGVGLSFVHKLVDCQGYTIRCEAKDGKTIFTIKSVDNYLEGYK